MNIDHKYMLRAIELGKNALGTTATNPMVGCVIVHDNKIIGEGFTSPFGGPHAEVNAVNSVWDVEKLKTSSLYVTLEPCSHFGKTPPCADLITKHQIPKVVIGLVDPNPKVAGKGIIKLKEAGCQVIVDVLKDECREHHKRFLTFQEKRRPYIILKWAETIDGFMAPEAKERSENAEPYWITNPKSRQLVHKWRSEEMAILVGTNTVLQDNPKLNTRDFKGSSPVRLVLDKDLMISKDFHVYDGSIKTIFITEEKDTSVEKNTSVENNVFYETIDFSGNLAQQISEVLYNHQINSVIIEGGLQTLMTFINANLWDEARIFKGNKNFDTGLKAPEISGELKESSKILDDTLTIFKNDKEPNS